MSNYQEVSMRLSASQLTKIKSAIKNDENVTIQVGDKNFTENGNVTLNLTETQLNKVDKLNPGKQVRLNLSKTQLGKMKDTSDKLDKISLKVTSKDVKQIDNELSKLMTLNDFDESNIQSGDGIGAIFKLALPFVKKVLPKVLGTLGMAAATGAVSGATHKATSGKGLRRITGGKIDLTRDELEEIMKPGNACHCQEIVDDDFIEKMNKDVKLQRAGFLPVLLGGLAASLLPSLFGKGLKRASGIRRAKGLRRVGDKA